MNVIRVYSVTALLLFITTITLVLLDHWKWALIPVCLAFGLMAVAVSALVDQLMQANSLLRSQLNALMAFFHHNGVKVEGQEGP